MKRKTKLNPIETESTNKRIIIDSLSDENYDTITPLISPYFRPLDRLSKDFFTNKSCIELSKELLGQIFCRRLPQSGTVLKGKIVETEAYLGVEDKASHTYGGRRTNRNEPMFMRPGTCYVYFTYGMYHCFNLSAEGEGAAVLLRAVQPLDGIACMQSLRAQSRKGANRDSGVAYKLKMLANGPSKLCMAFDINKNNMNKVDITDSDLIWIEKGDRIPAEDIAMAKRIGISGADEWTDKPLRFYLKNCEFVSKK